jgi:hypothetical protein
MNHPDGLTASLRRLHERFLSGTVTLFHGQYIQVYEHTAVITGLSLRGPLPPLLKSGLLVGLWYEIELWAQGADIGECAGDTMPDGSQYRTSHFNNGTLITTYATTRDLAYQLGVAVANGTAF